MIKHFYIISILLFVSCSFSIYALGNETLSVDQIQAIFTRRVPQLKLCYRARSDQTFSKTLGLEYISEKGGLLRFKWTPLQNFNRPDITSCIEDNLTSFLCKKECVGEMHHVRAEVSFQGRPKFFNITISKVAKNQQAAYRQKLDTQFKKIGSQRKKGYAVQRLRKKKADKMEWMFFPGGYYVQEEGGGGIEVSFKYIGIKRMVFGASLGSSGKVSYGELDVGLQLGWFMPLAGFGQSVDKSTQRLSHQITISPVITFIPLFPFARIKLRGNERVNEFGVMFKVPIFDYSKIRF